MNINVKEYHVHMHGSHISFFSYLCVFILLGILGFCIFDKKELKEKQNSIKINIEGMTCSHCESNIVNSLLSLKGIRSVQANYQSGQVILEGSNYDINKIEKIIESLNYKVISK